MFLWYRYFFMSTSSCFFWFSAIMFCFINFFNYFIRISFNFNSFYFYRIISNFLYYSCFLSISYTSTCLIFYCHTFYPFFLSFSSFFTSIYNSYMISLEMAIWLDCFFVFIFYLAAPFSLFRASFCSNSLAFFFFIT